MLSLTLGLTLYVLATVPSISGFPVPGEALPPGWALTSAFLAFGFFLYRRKRKRS